jgi:uncharacterized protein (TIGR00251 family)
MDAGSVVLEAARGGVLLLVQAKPKASRNGLAGIHAGRLKVAVTAAPEKGKANAAVLVVLAESLGLRRAQVSLAAGETGPRKTVLVTGVDVDELRRRIAAVAC